MRHLALLLAILTALFPLEVLAQAAQVLLVSPQQGEELTGRDVEIAVSYNAGSEKVTYIEILIDGNRYAGKYLKMPQSRGVCSFVWDTTNSSNGSHPVIVKLFSGDKLLGSVSGDLRVGNKPVDVVPPTIKFYGVKSGETFSGVRELKLTAQDNSGKSPIVSVSVDKNLKLIKNNPPYSYAWDTTKYADGQHEVEAWGYDESGNREDAGSVTVNVKNGAKAAQTASAAPASTEKPQPKPAEQAKTAVAQVKQESPAVPSISVTKKTEPARSTGSEPKIQASLSGIAASTKPVAVKTEAEPKVAQPSPVIMTQAPKPEAKPVDVALAEPKMEGFAAKPKTEALKSMPAQSSANKGWTGELLSDDIQTKAQGAEVVTEPSATETKMALAPSSSVQTYVDPLTIPASRTSPSIRVYTEVASTRVSSASFEHQDSSVATTPGFSGMSPHISTIRSASADIHGVISGREAGVKSVHPEGGMGVMVAAAPPAKKVSAAAKPAQSKTMPMAVKGTVKLVFGDSKVSVNPEDPKSIPVAALRNVMEQLGAMVVWDQQAKTITAYNNGVRITMKVGAAQAQINGKKVTMRTPVTILEDHAMVDLKFLQKTFKMELEYDPQTGAFTLRRK